MQQQQTESILVSWIEISWLFAVRTDFTNLTVMLSDLLRNLTYNRSAHCTQVSDQCPLGLLFVLSRCFLDFSVGVRAFGTGLSQISSFFSYMSTLVSRNNRIKRVTPCLCRTGTLKNPTKCIWRWEPDRRFNIFFSPPVHLCRWLYNWNIVTCEVKHQYTSSPAIDMHIGEVRLCIQMRSLPQSKLKHRGMFDALCPN